MGRYEDPQRFIASLMSAQGHDKAVKGTNEVLSAINQLIAWTEEHIATCSDKNCGHATVLRDYYKPLRVCLAALQGHPEVNSVIAAFLGCIVILLGEDPLLYATRFDGLFREIGQDAVRVIIERMEHGNA